MPLMLQHDVYNYRLMMLPEGPPSSPGICDTTRIRMTIITVDSTVVATESEYALSCTGMEMVSGINCGETSKPNNVIPRTNNVY
jgi:hypothetical protein